MHLLCVLFLLGVAVVFLVAPVLIIFGALESSGRGGRMVSSEQIRLIGSETRQALDEISDEYLRRVFDKLWR